MRWNGIDYSKPFLFMVSDDPSPLEDWKRGVPLKFADRRHRRVADEFLRLHYLDGVLKVVEIANLRKLLQGVPALQARAADAGVSFMDAFSAALMFGDSSLVHRFEAYSTAHAEIVSLGEIGARLWGPQGMAEPNEYAVVLDEEDVP